MVSPSSQVGGPLDSLAPEISWKQQSLTSCNMQVGPPCLLNCFDWSRRPVRSSGGLGWNRASLKQRCCTRASGQSTGPFVWWPLVRLQPQSRSGLGWKMSFLPCSTSLRLGAPGMDHVGSPQRRARRPQFMSCGDIPNRSWEIHIDKPLDGASVDGWTDGGLLASGCILPVVINLDNQLRARGQACACSAATEAGVPTVRFVLGKPGAQWLDGIWQSASGRCQVRFWTAILNQFASTT